MQPIRNPNISYFAKTNFRSDGKLFGILQRDRMMHSYIVGKTGAGKTNLLATLILQDINEYRGCCIFDVHGDLVQSIKANIPKRRRTDVLDLDIANPAIPFRYNPLRKVSPEKRSLVTAGLLDTFHKLWRSAWGAKLEHILRYIILTLLTIPKATLADIPWIIHDKDFRNDCLAHIESKEVQSFWTQEFPKYSKNDVVPILNKVGAFLAHPALTSFLITNPHDISLRRCMDEGKIVLVDISKGKLGSDAANLVGSVLITAMAHAAFSRIDTLEEDRRPFNIFLDEFQNYTTPSITGMLSELRKFRVSLTLANQYLYQLEVDIRNAVLGNVGTLITFRLGQQDASYFAKEFQGIFEASDFTHLENYSIYLKLMIDGKPSRPFSADTIAYTDILKPP